MQTNRGIVGKPLTILIIALAIALTIAAYLSESNNDSKRIDDQIMNQYSLSN